MIKDTKKTFLVLPGTVWQLALIDKIRELGHKVLVVNPATNSPGFGHADGYLKSDIFDKEKVISYGKMNNVNAILSDECDIAMNLIAQLGEELNVPVLDCETAALFTDKFLMREFSKKLGLKFPEYKLCKNEKEAVDFYMSIGKPMIIKPLDSNASHGVFRIDSIDDIHEHFNESMSFSRQAKAVLLERYINGTEFTIDSIKTPSKQYALAISEKKHYKHNDNIANELLFSHSNPKFNYDKLIEINNRFVENSKLLFGFTHAEYKFEDGDYYLIEIAARGGGNMISSVITQYMSGFDTYKYLIDCACGNIHEQDFNLQPQYRDRCAVLKFFETPKNGGKVIDVHGLNYLIEEPDIVKYKLNFNIGDNIENAKNDSVRIGFYIATSENMSKLKQVMNNVESYFKIILED